MSVLRPLARSLTPCIAPVPNRTILSLSGSQATIFLHGVLSSAIHDPPKPQYSSFLNAQGRVMYDVFVYTRQLPTGQTGYLVEYDPRRSEAKVLFDTLKRYVLRAKVKIRDASEEYDVWAKWGGEQLADWDCPRQWTWSKSGSGALEPAWADRDNNWPWGLEHERIRDRRAIGMGERMLVKKGERPKEAATHDVQTSDDYTLHRILHGVPEGKSDIVPTYAFPMESNLDVMGGVDFRKGCYVGQELTVRTYHTGMIRKRVLPVLIHKPDETPSEVVLDPSFPKLPLDLDIRGLPVPRAPDDPRPPLPRPRGTGKLLTSMYGVGLGLLRMEQLDAVQRGDLKFTFDDDGGRTWGVTHWFPEDFPRSS